MTGNILMTATPSAAPAFELYLYDAYGSGVAIPNMVFEDADLTPAEITACFVDLGGAPNTP